MPGSLAERAWGWLIALAVAGGVARAQVPGEPNTPAGPAPGEALVGDGFEETKDVGLTNMLGARVPGDIPLFNSRGERVEIGRYFGPRARGGGKPIVLVLAYYRCPMICPMVIEQLVEDLNAIDYAAGIDYQVLVVSFDPTETTEAAADARARALAAYRLGGWGAGGQPGATPEVEAGFEFFTARAADSRRLADSIGFGFKYLPRIKEYSHPTVLTILSSEGVVTRYLSGLDNSDAEAGVDRGRDLRLALLEATDGRIASGVGDWFMHLCFRFDPEAGVYVLGAMKVMRLGGLLTLVLLVGLVAWLRVGESRRRKRKLELAPGAMPGAAGLHP